VRGAGEAEYRLGAAAPFTVALLAPEAIVIGGGLSQAGAALFEPLERRLDAILTFQRRPKLMCASLGESSGLIGAAISARDCVDHPDRLSRLVG
jgi:glucokinase